MYLLFYIQEHFSGAFGANGLLIQQHEEKFSIRIRRKLNIIIHLVISF